MPGRIKSRPLKHTHTREDLAEPHHSLTHTHNPLSPTLYLSPLSFFGILAFSHVERLFIFFIVGGKLRQHR